MQNKTELSFEDRVQRVYRKLCRYFSVLPEEKYAVAEPLIRTYSFYKIECDELEKIIASNGATEKYRNGENQQGMKISAAISAHLKVQKNLQLTAVKLLNILPEHLMYKMEAQWTVERIRLNNEFKEYIRDGERDEDETFDQWRARKDAMFSDPDDEEDDDDEEAEDTDDDDAIYFGMLEDAKA